ncbi:MAG: hypothetical protein O3B01_26010 [Planctomycetota bacterium]|nr:hypothetical protein [Planctomycetota bacterium]
MSSEIETGKFDVDERGEDLRLSIGYDKNFLYLCYTVANHGPMKNTGEDWRLLFKTGASVDLQLGRDPAADPMRRAPTRGDMRLLMTAVDNRPRVVLYEPLNPSADPSEAWTVTSPVGKAKFDRVVELDDVRLYARPQHMSYIVEVAIPLKTLGIKPKDGLRLKMDWGVLRTGPDGYETVERTYWSNKATGITADRPSEARLSPDMWGHLLFHSKKGSTDAPPVPETSLGKEPKEEKGDPFLEGLEED